MAWQNRPFAKLELADHVPRRIGWAESRFDRTIRKFSCHDVNSFVRSWNRVPMSL